MAKIQTTLPHRYGRTVTIAGLGAVKFDEESGQAELAEHLTDLAHEAAAHQGAGFVVVTEEAEDPAPKTRAQVKALLLDTPYPSLQAKCRTAKFPETEWKHLRGQVKLAEYVVEQVLAMMPEDDSLDAAPALTTQPQV